MPSVSVLLPVRNARATLERAARSILDQSWKDLELIAIDDGSDDGSAELLAMLAESDSRVVVLSTPAEGHVSAINRGLRCSTGAFIARMDADDESLPTRLEKSLALLEAHPSLAAVGTRIELFREDRPISPNMAAYGRWLNSLCDAAQLFADRFIESPLCNPSTTVRRSALEEVGGWQDNGFAEDYQLWLELLARGHALSVVPEVLFRWRDHDHRLTRCDPRFGLEQLLALKARYLAASVLPAGKRCAIWGAGAIGLQLARKLRQQGVEIEQLIDVDDQKIGQQIDGTKVVSYQQLEGPDGLHLISAVGAKGARAAIRTFLAQKGWREGVDFTCAA